MAQISSLDSLESLPKPDNVINCVEEDSSKPLENPIDGHETNSTYSQDTITNTILDSVIMNDRDVNGYDYLLKLIIIGNSCVGKSNLTMRFTKDDFEIENETTIGVDFAIRTVCLDSKVYKLHLWDTAGQDTFKVITRSYYRNSIGAVIAYDVTNRESFDAVRGWIEELQERAQPYVGKQSIVIVGNKSDRTNDRQVLTSEGESLAAEFGFKFFETSAKTGENVKNVFCYIVADINQKIKSGELEYVKSDSLTLAPTDTSNGSMSSYCSC